MCGRAESAHLPGLVLQPELLALRLRGVVVKHEGRHRLDRGPATAHHVAAGATIAAEAGRSAHRATPLFFLSDFLAPVRGDEVALGGAESLHSTRGPEGARGPRLYVGLLNVLGGLSQKKP